MPPRAPTSELCPVRAIRPAARRLAEARPRSLPSSPLRPGHARVEVLRRAMTSPLLLKRPLERSQVDHLFRTVGVDGRGLVSCARFNGQLGVLPPMSPPPPRPSCLRRCARGLLCGWGQSKRKPAGRYDEADDDSDGTLASTDGLRPITERPHEFTL